MSELKATGKDADVQARHGCPADIDHDRNVPEIDLLSPLAIRGVTFCNRIVMSPMCQYCATEGMADDWHLVHLGSRAVGGVSLVMVEATAVTRDGRITSGDLGIWDNRHVEPLARIARFVRSQGRLRESNSPMPGERGVARCRGRGVRGSRRRKRGAGPSSRPARSRSRKTILSPSHSMSRESTAWSRLSRPPRRAVAAGFRVIEIHSAHGYLLHEFLSPLSNQRDDRYGGSLENRMRLVLRVCAAIRGVMTDDMPLFVRISATDWEDGGWDVEQSIVLARRLKEHGADLIDVSSGALVPKARIPVGRGLSGTLRPEDPG